MSSASAFKFDWSQNLWLGKELTLYQSQFLTPLGGKKSPQVKSKLTYCIYGDFIVISLYLLPLTGVHIYTDLDNNYRQKLGGIRVLCCTYTSTYRLPYS